MSTRKARRCRIVQGPLPSPDTSPIPRDQLRELIDRVRRGEVALEEARVTEDAVDDRPTPVVVHSASIEAWLAAKR